MQVFFFFLIISYIIATDNENYKVGLSLVTSLTLHVVIWQKSTKKEQTNNCFLFYWWFILCIQSHKNTIFNSHSFISLAGKVQLIQLYCFVFGFLQLRSFKLTITEGKKIVKSCSSVNVGSKEQKQRYEIMQSSLIHCCD